MWKVNRERMVYSFLKKWASSDRLQSWSCSSPADRPFKTKTGGEQQRREEEREEEKTREEHDRGGERKTKRAERR